MSINMNKEYRRELKALGRAEAKLRRDLTRHGRDCLRSMRQLEARANRGRVATEREIVRLRRRQSILEGKLV